MLYKPNLQNEKSDDDEFYKEFDKPKQRAHWNQESFGKLEPAELASTDKSYLFKRKEEESFQPDRNQVDFTRFNETVKEEEKEISDLFAATKR